jgi:UTP--glucose-1-phosphate uridylyltransferase
MGILDDPRVDMNFLLRHGFEPERFEAEAEAVRSGELTPESSILRGSIEPAESHPFDPADSEAKDAGEEALSQGRVALVVLNGGMATRFGGVVKGVVEVFDQKSFIELKCEDARRVSVRYGAPVPLVLMNSFATDTATRSHLRMADRFGLRPEQVSFFEQTISLRLTPEGELFEVDGELSPYAPGHGDFYPCVRGSGVLKALRERGVEHLLFSNVDNLGATADPRVIGHHLRSGAAMTVEVTEKRRVNGKWDKGGAPAVVDGQLQIVEGFRFPPDFAQEQLPDFSTNTFHFRLADLDRPIVLSRHAVRKEVGGKTALQLESIACEASALRDDSGQPLLPLHLLRVDRDSEEEGRFFPTKAPEDLERNRDALERRLNRHWDRLGA